MLDRTVIDSERYILILKIIQIFYNNDNNDIY